MHRDGFGIDGAVGLGFKVIVLTAAGLVLFLVAACSSGADDRAATTTTTAPEAPEQEDEPAADEPVAATGGLPGLPDTAAGRRVDAVMSAVLDGSITADAAAEATTPAFQTQITPEGFVSASAQEAEEPGDLTVSVSP